MKIYFVNNINESNNVIKVASIKKNCDIQINNHLDIINVSSKIKTLLNYNSNFKKKAIFNLEKLDIKFAEAFIYRILQGNYYFDKYKKNNIERTVLYFYVPQMKFESRRNITSIINGSYITRDIINEPSNIATPENFVKYSKYIFRDIKNVKITVFNEKHMKKMGLNLINAVGIPSQNKPRFLIIDYNPSIKNKKTICLVGKGVTIDTGGYSMKKSESMVNMYMDKEGASISVGIVYTLSKEKYKNRIICLCPLVENIVSHSSLKPNDIIKAYNGQTVEIVNTDAEGRLILADALTYACNKYKPDYIFDYATLTGWSQRINCHSSFTYFTSNEKIARDVEEYGNKYSEKNIRIPAWLEYISFIKSRVADVKNSGYDCKNSDGLMASLFLMNFIPKKYRKNWSHFDIRISNYNNNVNIADGFATFYSIIKNI
jgi:leucyl aminopeptidase